MIAFDGSPGHSLRFLIFSRKQDEEQGCRLTTQRRDFEEISYYHPENRPRQSKYILEDLCNTALRPQGCTSVFIWDSRPNRLACGDAENDLRMVRRGSMEQLANTRAPFRHRTNNNWMKTWLKWRSSIHDRFFAAAPRCLPKIVCREST